MKANTARLLRALFWVYVAGTFAQIVYVVSREPFAFDAWNVAVDTGAKPASISRFFSFWHQQYTTSNPRIGQPMAYLAYKLVGVGEIGTAVAFFAIVIAGFTLGAGRLPSRKNDRDLAVLALGIGSVWFMAPNFPAYLFCRAYATNYVWLIAIQLWFLVPLRLHLKPGALGMVGYFVLGIVAGMGNEHVGPTLILSLIVFALYQRKRAGQLSRMSLIAVASTIIGYALIFFAPGQSQRYEGLAEHYSAVQQILVRGITTNLDIYVSYLEAIAPVMLLIVGIVAVGMLTEPRSDDEDRRAAQRRALGFIGVALVAGTLITMTVFASPKLGPRFYFHSGALILGGMLGIASAFLSRPKAFVPFTVIAVIASGYAFARTVPRYTQLHRASQARLAELEATPIGGVQTLESWEPTGETWWSLGDDARDQLKQEMIAKYYALDRVLFRSGDLWKSLGVSDVKLTMHYDVDPAQCLDEVDKLDLKPYVGRDVAALHHAFLDALTEVRKVTHAHVRSADLSATFLGSEPPLPAKTILVARWSEATGLVGYTAKIGRSGRAHARSIVPSPALAKEPFDMYILRIGDPAKKLGTSSTAGLAYEPWGSGIYWVLACKPEHCFVVATANHVI